MSNNKQSMKLYTTDQVIDIFEKYGNMSAINARNIIDLSESIEIPSDEEIRKEVFYQKQVMNPYPTGEHSYTAYEKGFMDCAESILLKIQGGNNEQ